MIKNKLFYPSLWDTTRRKEGQLVLGIALLLLALWIILPKPAFWGVDNGVKYLGAESFANHGTLKLPYFGLDFDPQGAVRPLSRSFSLFENQKQIPVFSPLFLALCGVMYKILGPTGPSILPLIGGWLALAAAWVMWIRHRHNRDGRLFLLMLGLGSPLLFYSLTLWEYSLAMALITGCLAFISRGRTGLQEPTMWEPLVAGVMLAVASALRTEALLWAPIILIFWSQTGRRSDAIWSFIGGLTLGLGFFGAVNHLLTGHFTPMHLLTNNFSDGVLRRSFRQFVFSRLHNFYVILAEGFIQNHYSALGILPLFAVVAWRRWRVEHGYWYGIAGSVILVWMAYMVVSLSSEDRAGHMLFSGGLIWVVPFIVLGLVKLRGERRRFWHLIWMGSLLFIAVVAFTAPHTRGVHWGPRFILLAIPPLLMIGATRAQRWWGRCPSARPVIVLLAALSIINQLYSLQTLRHTMLFNQRLNSWVTSPVAPASITKLWWLPGDVALSSGKVPWYIIRGKDPHEMEIVIQGLKNQGLANFCFYELPPYHDSNRWIAFGATPLENEQMPRASGIYAGLQRTWFSLIPPPEQSEAPEPANNPD